MAKKQKQEEVRTWLISSSGSIADNIFNWKARGTKEQAREYLLSLILEDAEDEDYDYGTDELKDIKEIEDGKLYAYSVFNDHHNDYTATIDDNLEIIDLPVKQVKEDDKPVDTIWPAFKQTTKEDLKVSPEELAQAMEDVQEEFSGFGNGHSGYMVVGVKKDSFLRWAAMRLIQLNRGLFDELIGELKFEEGENGITVAYFEACEKYAPQLNDLIERSFPDAIVYGWGCWDSVVIEAPDDAYTTKLDTTFEDMGNLRIDVKVTDKKSGCSFCIGDLICFSSADDCVNPDDETYNYLTGLLSWDEKAQVEECLSECYLYHGGSYDEDDD